MNSKVYIWTVILSFLLLLPACIWSYPILTILSGIGCSGFAAAIMAFFIENASLKKENERKAKAKSIYFKSLEDQLKMMLERILWFDARLDEKFDWSQDSTTYSTFHFMVSASQQYPEQTISYEEADKRLEELKTKYSLEQQSHMSPDKLANTQKMFSIIAASSRYLLSEVNTVKDNMIPLDSEGFISLADTKQLLFDISLSVSLMNSPNKNYGLAIAQLTSSYKKVRSIGKYFDDIRIGLHGSINMSEL